MLPADALHDTRKTLVWETLKPKLSEMISTHDEFMALFDLSPAQLNVQQRTDILRALKGRLREIIPTVDSLRALFAFPENKLNHDQRALVWDDLKPMLGQMISTGAQLHGLLNLSATQLHLQQRTDILIAVRHRLVKMIPDLFLLCTLFSLPREQLNASNRMRILNALKSQLPKITPSPKELKQLFSSLCEPHGKEIAQITKALKNQMDSIISDADADANDDADLFFLLLSFPREQLHEGRRERILAALENRPTVMIPNHNRLMQLLTCGLNDDERSRIWKAIEGQMDAIKAAGR